MIIQNALVYTPRHTFEKGSIVIREGRIVPFAAPEEGEEVLDAQGLYALPGLVDIHFHGAMGKDFCDGKEEAIQTLADFEASKGVLAICPATMTFSEEILNGVMDAAAAHKNGKGADLVGILELCLEAAVHQVSFGIEAIGAQICRHGAALHRSLGSQRDQGDVAPGLFRHGSAAGLHHQLEPLQTDGEAYGRLLLTAHEFYQAVIPSAAAHSALGADGPGLELEYGLGVVVQTPDDGGIYLKGNAHGSQTLLELLEVLPALVTEVIQDDGGMFSQLVAVLLLAVQDTHGIALQTVLTGGA